MILLSLLLAAAASAQPAKPVSASGYLKDVYQYSSSAFDGRPYFLNTARARLTLDARVSLWRAHLDYDHESLAGSYFRTAESRLFGLGQPAPWLDMEHDLGAGDTALWRHRLYRGWAGVESGKWVARFGRQRIAWGTGKLWNPTDVLNPYQPLSVERDERRGVDAFYLRRGMGLYSQAELAYAPRDRWTDSAALARLKSHWGEFDVSLMGGKVASSTKSWMAGGDFAGNLWQGSAHGEWSYAEPRNRAPYWKAVLGYEYTFTNETKAAPLRDAALLAEVLHSGSGTRDTARYDLSAVLTGKEVTLARDYLGLSYSKDVHPLLKLELVALANLNDGSQFFSPTLQWNALDNLYLTGGLQRFGGTRGSEFGRPANLAFAQGQYFF